MSATVHSIRTGAVIPAARPPLTLLLAAVLAEAVDVGDREAFDDISDALCKIHKRNRWRTVR